MSLDLSSIQLPEDQANQSTQATGDTLTPETQPSIQVPDQSITTDQSTDTQTQQTDQSQDQTNNPENPDNSLQQTDEKLTPFHEHPDWKKMQEEKRGLELQLAELKGRVESIQAPQEKIEKLPYANVTEMAHDLMAKKKAAGWQPQSAEEVAMVTQDLWEQARSAFKDQEDKIHAETAKQESAKQDRAAQEIISTVKTLGLDGEANKETRDKLFAIAGKIDPHLTRPQRDVLNEAMQIMQMFPQASAEQVGQAVNSTAATNDPNKVAPTAATNNKISQGGSTGTGNSSKSKSNKPFAQFKSENLDQVVSRLATENNWD